MAQDEEQPIAREPWQRLLGERDAAPPETTDARIRAAARRAPAPRTRAARWWLPASLAASFLLAVMLVQWQFGEGQPALVTESDVVAPMILTAPASAPEPAIDLPAGDTAEASAVLPLQRSPVVAPETAQEYAPAPQVAPPPALPATESAREREEAALMDSSAEARQSAPARAVASRELGNLGALSKSGAEPQPPDEWYARIEALRVAGHDAEADAELARLEAAWPGWLEKNHPQPR
ncbi:MAG: hypothetical protein WD929_05585 [Steroidobacteraceae bacterium]